MSHDRSMKRVPRTLAILDLYSAEYVQNPDIIYTRTFKILSITESPTLTPSPGNFSSECPSGLNRLCGPVHKISRFRNPVDSSLHRRRTGLPHGLSSRTNRHIGQPLSSFGNPTWSPSFVYRS